MVTYKQERGINRFARAANAAGRMADKWRMCACFCCYNVVEERERAGGVAYDVSRQYLKRCRRKYLILYNNIDAATFALRAT